MTTTQEIVRAESYSDKALIDVFDEALIREELAGVSVDELVYQFPMGGKTVTGLTVYGVIAMARLAVDSMPNISIEAEEPKSYEREKSWKSLTKVTYTNKVTNSSVSFWGEKSQPKEIALREPNEKGETTRIDPNAEQIADVKSLRNALIKIFPPKKSAEFLNQFRSEGKIKEITPEQVKNAASVAEARGKGAAKETETSELLQGSEENEFARGLNMLGKWGVRTDKGVRLANDSDTIMFTKLYDGTTNAELAPEISTILAKYENSVSLNSWRYYEEEEAGFLWRKKL